MLSCSAALAVLSVAWAFLSHGGDCSTNELGVGVLTHLVCAASGIAVALPCSRLLVRRSGRTVVLTVLLTSVVLLVKWVPLVHPLLVTTGSGRAEPSVLAGSAVAATVAVAASPLLVGLGHLRRD